MAHSSTEEKYKALSTATAETIWTKTVLHELGIPLSHTPTLWCDNLRANYISTNPVFCSKMKHMDIDVHFIHDKVAAQCFKISFCPSQEQLANVLTKTLPSTWFIHLHMSLNVLETPLDSWGYIKIKTSQSNKEISY